MYAPLTLIVLALAATSVVAARLPRRSSPTREQVQGFLYVGAVALVALAVSVVVLGGGDPRRARAEGLAIFGLFTYVLYLLAAYAIVALTTPPPEPPPGRRS